MGGAYRELRQSRTFRFLCDVLQYLVSGATPQQPLPLQTLQPSCAGVAASVQQPHQGAGAPRRRCERLSHTAPSHAFTSVIRSPSRSDQIRQKSSKQCYLRISAGSQYCGVTLPWSIQGYSVEFSYMDMMKILKLT